MIEDSLGQLVCGGFQGTTVTRQAYELIVKYKISTMILSRKNAHSVQQMSKLIRDLQFIAYKHANYKYPLAFAIDEEGGMLNSLFDPENLTQFPGAMALAATGDVELVYKVLKALAIELKQIGFSIILGPVLDVITKLSHQLVSVRSFGTTIDEVTKYGKACARGLRDGGLITVGKHFPGIGNASVDSLLELPMMTDSLDEIRRFNLVPFAELIRENLLDGVSAAGCGVPTISPDETHACLLPILMTQLLRNDLGFQGFVISECLEMDALYHLIGLGQGVVLAIYAGCDLVMVCHDFKLQAEAIESIAKALTNGMLDEDIINASLKRLEAVQRRLPTWREIFPNGEDGEPQLFKELHPDIWEQHQKLSEQAYRSSITLVRDYEGILPLTQYVGEEPNQNILLLTPLLNPVYPKRAESLADDKKVLYTGEEVFQKFGELLALYVTETKNKFNVFHTTYTANGLTALHELLIENSRAVIIATSEALRNMYQIGIVKYVSILCGATPLSLSQSNSKALLAKPLVIVATLSPYDFFYNKSIGSAYLCCFDYTHNALKELSGALMGAYSASGCIPGEKKFLVAKTKKRRPLSLASPDRHHTKIRRALPPKRRWLVDEFDLNRDWRGLLKLFKANLLTQHSEGYFRLLVLLLHSNTSSQKHFVIRNSSLNILYGVVFTWVEEVDNSTSESEKIGRIVYIMVDKSKRLQLVGKNLHARAVRYLFKEAGCSCIQLGSLFPLIEFSEESNVLSDPKAVIFFNNAGWDLSLSSRLKEAHVVMLKELSAWTVPQKIFRELTIVGVRFDICMQPDKLQALIERATNDNFQDSGAGATADPAALDQGEISDRNRHIRYLYQEAINCMSGGSPYEVKIIIALEPTNQSVIGSIVLFTNKSSLARFYPFMEEIANGSKKSQLVGGIVGPVIDPSYLNLTEIFKFGLICSGITYLRSNFSEMSSELRMEQCVMVDVIDDKLLAGVKDIGFEHLRLYHDYYDKVSEDSSMVGE